MALAMLSQSVKLVSAASTLGLSLLKLTPHTTDGLTYSQQLKLKSLHRSTNALLPVLQLCVLREQRQVGILFTTNQPSAYSASVAQAVEILHEILDFFRALETSKTLSGNSNLLTQKSSALNSSFTEARCSPSLRL